MYFSKSSKFYEDFKNAIKFPEKCFGFLDNCIRVGYGKFSVLWAENLSSVINALKNRPVISDLSKRDVFQLNLPQNYERIR